MNSLLKVSGRVVDYVKCPACGTGAQGYGLFRSAYYCSGVLRRWLFFKYRDAAIPHLHYKCWTCGVVYVLATKDKM